MTTPHYAPTIVGSGVLPRQPDTPANELKAGDSAIRAFTDFTLERPFTVDEERRIDEALEDMIRLGVRALLVTRAGRVTGLITSYDIQGEKPLQFLHTSTYRHHQDICVGHIMTPLERWPAIDLSILRTLTAVDLLRSLYEDGLTHLLVVETDANDPSIVRGIVSRSWLARHLVDKPFVEGSNVAS